MSRKLLPTAVALLPAVAFAIGAGVAMAPGHANAADARNPYGNVDHRVDAGNNTGDSQVDQLNNAQLDQNYKGPYYNRGQQPAMAAPQPGYGATPPSGMPPSR
jgi:hypothetical protein